MNPAHTILHRARCNTNLNPLKIKPSKLFHNTIMYIITCVFGT